MNLRAECDFPSAAQLRLARFKYLWARFSSPVMSVGRPTTAGNLGGKTHMDSYAWIRVVTDDWEYTERVA